MTYNFRLFFAIARRSLFNTRNSNVRLSFRRVLVLSIASPVYFCIELVTWACFLLDRILFPAASRQEVCEPVFILGPPRCGTTLLHRMLAQDRTRFTSLRLWELVFAPTVTQKKILRLCGRVDARLGAPFHRILTSLERRLTADFTVIHKTGLFEVEEDALILLHIFCSPFLVFMFPYAEEIRPYIHFDMELPEPERKRIMAFYRRCVQNHLYVFDRGRRFLSKNPFFSALTASLADTFPDGKFIFISRDPLQVVPSALNLAMSLYRFFMSPVDLCPMLEQSLEMLAMFYRYPPRVFERMGSGRIAVLTYAALTADPDKTVTELYHRFGFMLSDAFREQLCLEKQKADAYRSKHSYSLSRFGLTRQDIDRRFAFVYASSGFPARAAFAVAGNSAQDGCVGFAT